MHCLIQSSSSASKDEHIHVPFTYSVGQIGSSILNNNLVLLKRENISGSSGFQVGKPFSVYLICKCSGKGNKQGHSQLLVQAYFKKYVQGHVEKNSKTT